MRLLSQGVLFSLRQSLECAQLWTIADNQKNVENVNEGLKRKPHNTEARIHRIIIN